MSGDHPRASHLLVGAAAAIIVIAGLKSAAALLIPFLLAIFIAILSAPLMHWLTARRVPGVVAVLIMLVMFLLIGVILVSFIGGTLNAFYQDMPLYQHKLQQLTNEAIAWLSHLGIEGADTMLPEFADPAVVMNAVALIFNGLGGVLANTFLILFTVIFILLEAAGFPAKVKRAFGDDTQAFAHFERFSIAVQRYLFLKTLISLGTGAVIALVLALMGVDYWALWGLIAFLLNYIPNIGSILAAVPAVLIALIQLGPVMAAATAAVYVIVNTLFGNIIEPRLMGQSLGLSTLVVFLSLVFWGWILGPVGMLLSIPLTMMAKIALETRPQTRWAATLMDH